MTALYAGAGLRVERGEPTDEELAAVVVALAVLAQARSATAAARPDTRPGSRPEGRSDPGGRLRRTPERRGPGAWRASGWR
ncbi:acyl-CoA carboxylase epsilon subunit [Kitasatospora sp. NPDC096147]|uniref:acyl-CoA carboxylase epsilon subunit n=1 Tax=Kitasatospora sp. NPDC096147 TaxID=3364093 RepID=UPI00380A4DC8